MIEEIESAVTFLTRLIAKSGDTSSSPPTTPDVITQEAIDRFSRKLCQLLEEKFRNHWFPDRPMRGQAFRCIRFNENNRRDSVVEKACEECGINFDDLKLPLELTLWVDPNEVTCRFGEHKGSYCIVAKLRDGRKENYIDSINCEELEQKTIERNRQASFDLLNSRKKRQERRKNGYNSYNGNGFADYTMGPSCSPSQSTFYPFYGSGTPFATQYGTSPPNAGNGFVKYPISPPQSRAVGGSGGANGSYRALNNKNNNYSNQTINSKTNNNFSRQLFAGGNAGFQSPFAYQPNDRYHWVNKAIVKA